MVKEPPEAFISILLPANAVSTDPAAKSLAVNSPESTWYKRIFFNNAISASVSKSSKLL